MTFTLIGAAVLFLGLLLMFTASRLAMLGFVLCCSVLNGSATVILTAMGNVSIQPALLATCLLVLRCLLPGRRSEPLLGAAMADNGWLLLLVGYSAVGAWTLPHLFQGAINVVPLRPTDIFGRAAYPLHFSAQNITTSFYMVLTLAGALCAHIAVRQAGAAEQLARLGCGIGLVHAALGWSAAAARGTPAQEVFTFFRNGYYMQVDQMFGGIARLTGISPEPSVYAAFGLGWFVFAAELWLRGALWRWSGPAALVLFLTLAASTSSTAYVGLAVYGAVILLRQTFMIGTIPAGKGLVIAACLSILGVSALALVAGSDEVARSVGRVLRLTTSDKLNSGSGSTRFLWARQGVDAFFASWGLGIGAGSFRSSSIVTALLGSSGVIGLAAMALYLQRVFRPFAGTTWRRTGLAELDVAAAAAWSAVMMLVPAAVSAASPDPGLVWGLMAGMTLGLRREAAALHRDAAPQTASVPVGLVGDARRLAGYQVGRGGRPGPIMHGTPAS